MKDARISNLTGELETVLVRQAATQEKLLEAMNAKLEAMRLADVEAMTASAHREGEIVTQAVALDQRRCWLAVELSKLLSMPIPPRAENVSLRSICSKLDAATRLRLGALGTTLRDRMLQVAETNRVVEAACRELLAHFRNIFSAFTHDGESPRLYSNRGAIEKSGAVQVLDAVG